MSASDTYTLAHTARCKLSMAASRPDRNLRFILGHAFTLDKLRLRIAEIELDVSDEENLTEQLSEPLGAPRRERRVSFKNNAARPPSSTLRRRERSPPPVDPVLVTSKNPRKDAHDWDDDAVEDDNDEDEDEDFEGLSLQRFESGANRRPVMIDDGSDDDDDDDDDDKDELKTPSPVLSDDELRIITSAEANEGLADTYLGVAQCPCHNQRKEAPKVSQVWDIPAKDGEHQRYAVVAVEA